MLQPRSFLFTRPNSHSPSPKIKELKNDRSVDMRRTRSPLKKDYKDMPSTKVSNDEARERPTTPSSPVVIPMRGHHDERERKRSQGGKESRHSRMHSEKADRRTRTVHSPDALPPSVAALLAITAIPLHKNNNHNMRGRSGSGQKLTVDAILQHTHVSEKEFGISFGRSPLDFLLSPPDDDDEETAESENGHESVLSTRTMSMESVPSLDDDSINDSLPSLGSLVTPGTTPTSRSKRPRKVLSFSHRESSSDDHPLARPEVDIDELDFRVFQKTRPNEEALEAHIPTAPRKSAFKSNLTASLRALRSVGKTFSSLKSPMITPDDFLTRSIISIDPQVPFTDERMPPRLEDTPTPALRRYLNPTTNAPIEAHVPSSLAQTMPALTCTASIQMQTYRVSRSSRSSSPSVISRRTQPAPEALMTEVAGPVARQRDMRENSDFIRVAVMEMLMRKKGKLDDQKPGRARWALPPRKPPTKPYEIADNGVPIRWIAITQT